ncbi:MAG: DUF1775 domain-containing protein [Rhodobacteraceae bacterium]|nr:DUF1775 domain-containing protein [Paracoccaceae bacterium]
MPRQSTAGIGEKYTVRVPTEGAKVTISAELRVPEGVHVYNVQAPINWTQDITRENGLITDVVWNVNIQSGEFMEFSFIALNPADAAQIVWTLRQNYSDGSSDDWTNGPDGPYSGAVTRLMPLPNQ